MHTFLVRGDVVHSIPLPDLSGVARDAEWVELVALLGRHKERMVDDFFDGFDGNVVYEGAVPAGDISDLVSSTMEMYLLLLAGKQLPDELRRLPADLGARRARQGVPAEQLLDGVRTNSRVIWNALRSITGPDQMECLVRNTGLFLGLVEWHVREVQYAYLREADRLQRRSETVRRQALRRLFEEPAPGQGELAMICRDLGLQAESEYALVVQPGQHATDCELCESGEWPYAHEPGRVTCHFRQVRLHESEGDEPSLSGRAAFFTPIQGVRGLLPALHTGHALLYAYDFDTPVLLTSKNTWAGVAWRAVEELFPPDLAPVDVSRVRALGPNARRRLLDTVAAYLANGSIKATAEQLFCHRNTIVKRLAQFEELIGLRFSVPNEAALVVLAIAALTREDGTYA